MKLLVSTLALLLLSSSAWACSAGDSLVKHYGVSFAGFEKDVPRAKPPQPLDDLVEVPLPDKSHVADGFHHTAYIDPVKKKAWILRTGGFIGVTEWYGPVNASTEKLVGCVTRRQQSLNAAQDLRNIQVPAL